MCKPVEGIERDKAEEMDCGNEEDGEEEVPLHCLESGFWRHGSHAVLLNYLHFHLPFHVFAGFC